MSSAGSSHSERIVQSLFEHAGIELNGSNPWDIQVLDKRFSRRVIHDTYLGLGESYMEGWWECDALDEMICRVLKARLEQQVRSSWSMKAHILRSRLCNLQAPSRTYKVGETHYDLGNDLYKAMLDSRMNYTCGYWRNAETLEDAQRAKLDLVCRKIGLKAGMHVLDLGCGWGSFAKYAAEMYGARVTGVTISREQVSLGRELCRGLPVELSLQDYRSVEGTYDAVVSIGIMEHVGQKNYRTYMEVTDRCLKKGGVAFIHTIGGNRSTAIANRWTTKYIFPHGMLPSIAQLGAAMEGLFVMEDWHNFGPDYDKTLMAWYDNFERAWPQFRDRYDEVFYRMWRFYLLSCAGSFRARNIQLWQIVMTRPGTSQPDCRIT